MCMQPAAWPEPDPLIAAAIAAKYSGKLNPDEWVWNNVKNGRLGRLVSHDRDDLKSKAVGALRRLQKLPGLVSSFSRSPDLAYITG